MFFRVFPNPSEDYTSIAGSCSDNEQIYVNISDITGRNVHDFVLNPTKNQFLMKLDIKTWAGGIYFAEIRSSQEFRVVKIVKN